MQGADDASFALSLMLIGSVAFVLTLFYLLNSPDPHIQSYSWNVLSGAICTFMGVRVGTAWNAMVTFYVLGPDASPLSRIAANGILSLSWYLLLQIVLAWVCGLFKHAGHRHSTDIVHMVLNLKCWAVMLGIVTGASSMGFFSMIQDLGRDSFLWVISMPVVAFFVLGGIYHVGDNIRTHVSKMDDDEVDLYEAAWDKYTDQTEDVVIALTVGHLVVQSSRYLLTGTLPLPTGEVRPGTEIEDGDVWTLAGSSLIYISLIVGLQFWTPQGDVGRMLQRRGAQILANCTAFALFYSTNWSAQQMMQLTGTAQSLVVALGVTWVAFGCLLLLDFLADLECTGERFDRALRQMVAPISVLIGFGWKGAFATAGNTLVADIHVFAPPLENLLMCLILLSFVLPAWRMYILPVVMLDELRAMRRKKGILKYHKTVEGMAIEELMDAQAKHAFHKLEVCLEAAAFQNQTEAYIIEMERMQDALQTKLAKLRSQNAQLDGSKGTNGNAQQNTDVEAAGNAGNAAAKAEEPHKGPWSLLH
ncbi:unnamed protein product [Symbiodinium natans]|uniref:Uncharacterized protein n=1 Tax=Symbiodinium natans TaxID=878477 RepID=A0A812KDP4_9DINO|nr:unnamed protein product [Symbiodinium natans]